MTDQAHSPDGQLVWRPVDDGPPPYEGRYLCALRASRSRSPRLEFCYWTKAFKWANKYVTHWMPLPRNPND